MDSNLGLLPIEVQQIAESVSSEKQEEVRKVLNMVFQGVKRMKQQLDAVVVENEYDEPSMKVAKTIRLAIRAQRLDAEKALDAKRSEVQVKMLHHKTEDALWLKSKQIMQVLTKEIEDAARFKEETKVRFVQAQKQAKTQERILKISKFLNADYALLEAMTDETFETFLTGAERTYNEKKEQEQKIEAERIELERKAREEQELQRIENEKLKLQIKEKEAQIKAERAKADADRRAVELAVKKRIEEEQEKVMAEQKKIAEAERLRYKEEERKKAAPDREKLLELARLIEELPSFDLNTKDAIILYNTAKKKLAETVSLIKTKA